jgi:lipopolysaccharide export LptBFGC system permease protein LptF
MSGKRIGGIACLILGTMFAITAVNNLTNGVGPALDDSSGVGVSYAVGAFLPSVLAALLGLWLLKR